MIDSRLYQLVVEQSRDYAVFVLGTDGRILSWNAGAQRIKGYLPEEIVGRHFSVFYTADAIESRWPEHELRVANAEGRFEDEGWRVRKDGSRFWANVIITALRDEHGKLLGYSKFTRDLTERRMHEEALRQTEERFRLLIEGVVDYAIYMLDVDGTVTSWNSGAQRIKGYTREEIIGKHFSRFYLPADAASGAPWEALAEARRTGRSEDEGWRLRKDGQRFWARTVVSALYDAEGHLRGFAKVTQDRTQQRHIQDLETAAKNVSEFIATLAHELRNPLAPIRTAAEVMARLAPGDPIHGRMRETIERQSKHMAHILDDMLDIVRITRGQLVIERAPVDLGEAVRSAVEIAAPHIEAGAHKLDIDLPAAPMVAHGDGHRLTQLLANLLNNAARYTPSGGRISIVGRVDGDRLLLHVRDTGRGMEPELVERVFDMFFQGRSSLQRVGTGLGVGLALARRLAELHGGTLTARSDGPGKGSEFTLELPLAAETPAESAADSPVDSAAPAAPMAARRVLVVDDNVDAATTLHLLLRSLGHETMVVYDGPSALKAATEFHPDIILLDIGMPGMDGYEVAKRLRLLQTLQATKIVAVTGWGHEADRTKTEQAGFNLHLVKPVDLPTLQKALDQRNGATLH